MTRATGGKCFPERLVEMRWLPVLKLRQMDETLFGDKLARPAQSGNLASAGGQHVHQHASTFTKREGASLDRNNKSKTG